MMLTKEGYDDMFAGRWVVRAPPRKNADDDADDDIDCWWCGVKKDMMICLPADEEYEDHGDDDADDDADSWWSRVTKDCRPMSNTGTTAKKCYDDADDDADSWWCWLKKDMMICLLAHE